MAFSASAAVGRAALSLNTSLGVSLVLRTRREGTTQPTLWFVESYNLDENQASTSCSCKMKTKVLTKADLFKGTR